RRGGCPLPGRPRTSRGTRHASAPGALPPWPRHPVSPCRPVRASAHRAVRVHRAIPCHRHDVLATRDGSGFGRGGEAVMDFYEVVDQVLKILQQRGRLTYRSLKIQFKLDNATCEALKDELLFSHPVVDHDGRGVVWTGAAEAQPARVSASLSAQTSQLPA